MAGFTRNVIVELPTSPTLEAAADTPFAAGVLPASEVADLPALAVDMSFAPVRVPRLVYEDHPHGELYDTEAGVMASLAPENTTYLVRGTVAEEDLGELMTETERKGGNVFADVDIQPMPICPGSPPMGTDADVERLLCTASMRRAGLDGTGVLVAIVDTGVNMAYLGSRGKTPTFDAARSWSWNPGVVIPGSGPLGHGTMCAYDVCIAAPRCTLLDIALLRSITPVPGGTIMGALLSDAVKAYAHLLTVMSAPRRPGESRSLVVNNSWGMFHPSWDLPRGHAGNYSHNAGHPFNRIVVTLERAGADILFAAGNCGADCPDNRCQGVTANAIYGANSSPAVLSVAGVDISRARVGYSSIGPGCLTPRKPDVSGYTHFRGSGVYAADGGTSAACPVVAGVVAAVRSKRPYNPGDSSTSPSAIRNLVTSTAIDLGPAGYDYLHGHGVVDGCALASRVGIAPPSFELCRRFPWICQGKVPIEDICRRYPWLCRDLRWPIPPIPPVPPGPVPPIDRHSHEHGMSMMEGAVDRGDEMAGVGGFDAANLPPEELAYTMGFLHGSQTAGTPAPHSHSPRPERKKCRCEEDH